MYHVYSIMYLALCSLLFCLFFIFLLRLSLSRPSLRYVFVFFKSQYCFSFPIYIFRPLVGYFVCFCLCFCHLISPQLPYSHFFYPFHLFLSHNSFTSFYTSLFHHPPTYLFPLPYTHLFISFH